MDGAMTKAPLGGGRTGANPTDRAKGGETIASHRGQGVPVGIDARAPTATTTPRAPDARVDPDRTARADERAAAGPLPRRGVRKREVRALAREFGFTAHIRSRGEEKKLLAREAGFRARRWVVERTHSWLNRYRAI